MAARFAKGVLNPSTTIFSPFNTRTASLLGHTITTTTFAAHKRPAIRAIRAITDNKKAKDPAPAPPVHAAHHQHHHDHQHNDQRRKQVCGCPDCRWFPFHKPQDLNKLLSDWAFDRLNHLLTEWATYAAITTGNPLELPTHTALYYHLPGDRSLSIADRVAILNGRYEPDAATAAKDEGEGKGKAKGAAGKDDKEDDNGGGDGDDGMVQSGHDTAQKRAKSNSSGRDGGQNKKGGQDSEEVDHKNTVQDAAEDGKEGKKGKKGDTPPKNDEISPWDQRIPLEGRGWTFWL